MKNEKYECVQQLFDNEYCFDPKQLLLSLEAYLGRREMAEAEEIMRKVNSL